LAVAIISAIKFHKEWKAFIASQVNLSEHKCAARCLKQAQPQGFWSFSTVNSNISTALWICTIWHEPSSPQINLTKAGKGSLHCKATFHNPNELLGV
jgi:hypothetical protein